MGWECSKMKEVINILDSRTEKLAGPPASGGPALPTALSGEVGPQPASLWLDPESVLELPCGYLWFLSLLLYFW